MSNKDMNLFSSQLNKEHEETYLYDWIAIAMSFSGSG